MTVCFASEDDLRKGAAALGEPHSRDGLYADADGAHEGCSPVSRADQISSVIGL